MKKNKIISIIFGVLLCFVSGTPLLAQWIDEDIGKIYTLDDKVGINTKNPLRPLHFHSPGGFTNLHILLSGSSPGIVFHPGDPGDPDPVPEEDFLNFNATIGVVSTPEAYLTGSKVGDLVMRSGFNEDLVFGVLRNDGPPADGVEVMRLENNGTFMISGPDELPNEKRFIVKNNGNVGIGTSAPAVRLDVWGTTRATKFLGNGAGLIDLNADNIASGTLDAFRVQHGQYFITTAGANGQVWKSDGNGKGVWGTDNVNDADADATNELNTSVTLNGTLLKITDAGGDKIANLSSLINDADADATNELNTSVELNGTLLKITDAGGDKIANLSSLIDDADADATNELNISVVFNNDNVLEITDAGGTKSADLSGLIEGIRFEEVGNSFIGLGVANNNVGAHNSFLGFESGKENTTGSDNNFFGYQAGYKNTTGNENNFVGYQAGYNNEGSRNNFVGYGTGYANTGSNNNFVGHFTGMNNTGDHNIFMGDAVAQNNTGNSNVIIGDNAAFNKSQGNTNTYLGSYAGYKNISGSGNVFIGYGAGYEQTGSDKLYIENGTNINNEAYPLIYGNFATEQLAIGINDEVLMEDFALTVNGDINLVNGGSLYGEGVILLSDSRFKENRSKIKSAWDMVQALEGVTYTFKEEEGGRTFSKGKKYGFIAQEVQKVLPDLVHEFEDGYLGVRYIGFIPVLVEALKEQNEKIGVLEKALASLRSGSDASESVDVLNTEAILHQNVPNPFTTSTVIQYELPETVHTAQIIVYDLQGHQLKAFEGLKAGQGRVEIAGSTLKAGMYVYALLADGNVIGTKRMILTK